MGSRTGRTRLPAAGRGDRPYRSNMFTGKPLNLDNNNTGNDSKTRQKEKCMITSPLQGVIVSKGLGASLPPL